MAHTSLDSVGPLDAAAVSAKHGGTIKVYRRVDDLLADRTIDIVAAMKPVAGCSR